MVASFAFVFGCDLLCNFGIISFSAPAHTVVTIAYPNDALDGEHAHHTHAHHTSSSTASHDHNSHKPTGDTHEPGDQEDCCDDITQQFYSSLVSSSGASLASLIHAEAFKVISAFIKPDIFSVESIRGLHKVSTDDHHSNGPPGGKVGHHICILFCTFLI